MHQATRFKDLLAHGVGRSNGYDNIHAEPFWRRFNAELLDGGSFPNLEESKLEISRHGAYYNAKRRHPALLYLASNHSKICLPSPFQLFPV